MSTCETQRSIRMRIIGLMLMFSLSFFVSQAQPLLADSSVQSLTHLHKGEKAITTLDANVHFPTLLQGNEAEMMDYIEKFSTRRRDYIIRMHTKGKKLLPKAASILKQHHLPEELKVLLILESAYNAQAVSSAGAVGYWQFMDAVAKEYGLRYTTHISPGEMAKLRKKDPHAADSMAKAITKQKDDRKNFIKATHAAARYLTHRRKNLGDNWLLIVASYNCGVGNVWEAMQKSGMPQPSFWDIRALLPQETQCYVQNFITLNVIFNNWDKFQKKELRFTPVQIFTEDPFEENIANEMADVQAGRLK
jgi:membrane-bound lytic murein transglycosylase D